MIGVPGDTVELRFGIVYVNDFPLDEPYLVKRDTSNLAPVFVQQGFYFVLGDNRAVSCDSRDFGLVAKKLLKGRVRVRFWPLQRATLF